MSNELIPISPATPVQILDVRNLRVVLDQDLAAFFEVETRVLNQALKRNAERFPKGWVFQLSKVEFDDLKSQSVISSDTWGGRRSPPWAKVDAGTY